jgi:predicted ATPase
MGAGAADLARVINEVRERLPDVPAGLPLEPEQARFRFFDSLTTFLKNAARTQPLVLILDDLQWADTPSLLLLQFLAREAGESRLLIVVTYRNGEPGRHHPLSHTLAAVARVPGSQTLHLRGLSERDVTRFIELTTGQSAGDGVGSAVHKETEGNPFFVTEVVRLLVTEEQQPAISYQPSALSFRRACAA